MRTTVNESDGFAEAGGPGYSRGRPGPALPFDRDRAAGVLFGLAAGDRIGGPIRMALTLAESLAERRRFDADDLGDRYLAWYRSGRAFDTGAVAWQVLQRVDEGQSWRDAAARVHDESGGMTAGCNAAHRVAPQSLAGFIADDALPAIAAESARLTHWHPLAGDVASAVAVLCRSLLRGRPWDAALADAAAGRDPVVSSALAPASYAALDTGGFAPDVLKAAVHFVGEGDTFDDALAASIAFAGPSNYCPVLVGSIGGARWGASSMDLELYAHHPAHLLQRIESVVSALSPAA
jgi:ADP-ribosyl-[dinitrogen reductase] hydrolase